MKLRSASTFEAEVCPDKKARLADRQRINANILTINNIPMFYSSRNLQTKTSILPLSENEIYSETKFYTSNLTYLLH